MVVYGKDKLDEISLSAPTTVCEFKDGWMRNYVITPEEFGFARCTKADLLGCSTAAWRRECSLLPKPKRAAGLADY